MRISVALCTYNGARFLEEQLETILRQTRLPDELILSDDGSTDRTLAIAQEFASRASFPVTILTAPERLGSTGNFERAIRHCRGDLIALSDQDDRWHPERLARSASIFETQMDTVLVFTNGSLIDERGRPLAGSLWQRFGFTGDTFRRFTLGDYGLLCRERFITGATMMLRRSALTSALPIPAKWVHDAWFSILLSFHGNVVALNESLIEYRIHTQQQVGAASRWRQEATRQAAAHWARIHRERLQSEALEEHLRTHPPAVRGELVPLYMDRAAFLRFRDGLASSRLARAAAILRHWREYRTQAGGIVSAVKDWLLPRR
jgi:glycosyltransferase involved in cell wall biosynthesis